MIADDDRTMVRLIKIALGRLGREIHSAHNGDDALKLVRSERPSLLILDLNMPQRGGIEVLRVLSREHSSRKMAIIVLSAQAQPETADQAKEAGASAYFSKPVVLRDFVQRARALLEEVESASPT